MSCPYGANSRSVCLCSMILWDRISPTCWKNVWIGAQEEKNESLVMMKILKTRYYGEEIVFHTLLFQDLSNIFHIMMSFLNEKTKSIWASWKHTDAFVRSFKKNGMVPATTKEELDRILAAHPEIKEVFIDGTERPVQRSQEYEKQKEDYSWKKKKHTKKNIIVAWDNKMILWVTQTEWWKNHDYPLLQESWFMEVLLKYIIRVDLWFIWIKKDYPEHNINIPKRNYKSKPLTQDELDENWIISSIRVIIENIIWRAKKYRIISNKYRWRLRGDFRTVVQNRKHTVMLIACWLYNLSKSRHLIS